MSMSFVFVGDVKVGEPLARRLTEAGYLAASDVASADVVLTFCEGQTATEDVYFETNGLVQICAEGTYLIDLGATTPSFSKEIQAVALVNDLHAIDAPLFVGDPADADVFAHPESLRIFAGGEEDDYQAVLPLLEVLADEVTYLGVAGAGQTALAVASLQNAAQIASLMEADALCRVSGVDAVAMMSASAEAGVISGRVRALHEAVCQERFDGAFTLEMLMAELTMALAAADDVDLILPQGEAAQHLLELLAVIGGSDKGVAALSLIYGEESACAQHGLDWTRAERVYGDGHDHDHDDDCGCGHHHDDEDADYGIEGYDGLGGFGSYSNN